MSMYMFRDSRVSIHASVKDATCSHRRKQPVQQVSIHASVKDATTHHTQDSEENEVSIHASVKDATSCRHARLLFQFSFNPRICKRCDSQNSSV